MNGVDKGQNTLIINENSLNFEGPSSNIEEYKVEMET